MSLDVGSRGDGDGYSESRPRKIGITMPRSLASGYRQKPMVSASEKTRKNIISFVPKQSSGAPSNKAIQNFATSTSDMEGLLNNRPVIGRQIESTDKTPLLFSSKQKDIMKEVSPVPTSSMSLNALSAKIKYLEQKLDSFKNLYGIEMGSLQTRLYEQESLMMTAVSYIPMIEERRQYGNNASMSNDLYSLFTPTTRSLQGVALYSLLWSIVPSIEQSKYLSGLYSLSTESTNNNNNIENDQNGESGNMMEGGYMDEEIETNPHGVSKSTLPITEKNRLQLTRLKSIEQIGTYPSCDDSKNGVSFEKPYLFLGGVEEDTEWRRMLVIPPCITNGVRFYMPQIERHMLGTRVLSTVNLARIHASAAVVVLSPEHNVVSPLVELAQMVGAGVPYVFCVWPLCINLLQTCVATPGPSAKTQENNMDTVGHVTQFQNENSIENSIENISEDNIENISQQNIKDDIENENNDTKEYSDVDNDNNGDGDETDNESEFAEVRFPLHDTQTEQPNRLGPAGVYSARKRFNELYTIGIQLLKQHEILSRKTWTSKTSTLTTRFLEIANKNVLEQDASSLPTFVDQVIHKRAHLFFNNMHVRPSLDDLLVVYSTIFENKNSPLVTDYGILLKTAFEHGLVTRYGNAVIDRMKSKSITREDINGKIRDWKALATAQPAQFADLSEGIDKLIVDSY